MSEDEIECVNCGITPSDLGINPNRVGNVWYCSQECYDEYTKDEG
jgi:hypothetical protein